VYSWHTGLAQPCCIRFKDPDTKNELNDNHAAQVGFACKYNRVYAIHYDSYLIFRGPLPLEETLVIKARSSKLFNCRSAVHRRRRPGVRFGENLVSNAAKHSHINAGPPIAST
jgi:hypothetical protein